MILVTRSPSLSDPAKWEIAYGKIMEAIIGTLLGRSLVAGWVVKLCSVSEPGDFDTQPFGRINPCQ